MAARHYTQKYVHREFEKRIEKEMDAFEKEFGEGITFIEMSRFFAEFATFDFEKLKKMNGGNSNGRVSGHQPHEQS